MASFASGSLFNFGSGCHTPRTEAPCSDPPYKRFRSLFGSKASSTFDEDNYSHEPRIHPGPPPGPQSPFSYPGHYTTVDYPTLTSVRSAFVDAVTQEQISGGRHFSAPRRELIRCSVANEQDAQRGFRLFDGILMNVRDISSEELFLERMQIVYSFYDAYVAGLVNRSPLDITKALLRALSACLTKYFSTQSMLRTNRPFIAKVLHLDCPDMFCSHSDFVQAFLFTNASPEDEVIISLAEKVYADNNFDVCASGPTNMDDAATTSNIPTATTADQLFEWGTRIAERSLAGGNVPSFATRDDRVPQSRPFVTDPTTTLSDGMPFQEPKNGSSTTAMLIVAADFEALHNFIAYVLYLTPIQLDRRYNVNFDGLHRPQTTTSVACGRDREARKRRSDSAKTAIRTVIEKKRRDKIDSMKERSTACDAVLRHHTAQTMERNNDLLCHTLLMLFDKSLSSLLDRGFENLNARRGYAVSSAKEIGKATIYTGIIDTVGEVSTVLEGCTFENIAIVKDATDTNGDKVHHRLNFSLPIDSIVTDASQSGGANVHDRFADRGGDKDQGDGVFEEGD